MFYINDKMAEIIVIQKLCIIYYLLNNLIGYQQWYNNPNNVQFIYTILCRSACGEKTSWPWEQLIRKD